MDGKNLIFVGELTDLLKELHTDATANEEVSPVIIQDPNISPNQLQSFVPFVAVVTDPEVCQTFLANFEKLLKQTSSKTILVASPDKVNDKVLRKLTTLGLSDTVDSKATLKSLNYKTSFLLKALPSAEDLKNSDGKVVISGSKGGADDGKTVFSGTEKLKDKVLKITSMKEVLSRGEVLQVKKMSDVLAAEKEHLQNVAPTPTFQEFISNLKSEVANMEEQFFDCEESNFDAKSLVPICTTLQKITTMANEQKVESLIQFCYVLKVVVGPEYLSPEFEGRELALTAMFDCVEFLKLVADEMREGEQNLLSTIVEQKFKNRFVSLGNSIPELSPILDGLGFDQ